jgi:hypothetical protein
MIKNRSIKRDAIPVSRVAAMLPKAMRACTPFLWPLHCK